MNGDISAKNYFYSRASEHEPQQRRMYHRAANALRLYCDVSMRELCEMSDWQLKRVHNVGPAAFALIREECRAWTTENMNSQNRFEG